MELHLKSEKKHWENKSNLFKINNKDPRATSGASPVTQVWQRINFYDSTSRKSVEPSSSDQIGLTEK